MTVAVAMVLRIAMVLRTVGSTRMMLVELLGAIRPFELMTLTRDSAKRGGDDQQGKKFHRGAS